MLVGKSRNETSGWFSKRNAGSGNAWYKEILDDFTEAGRRVGGAAIEAGGKSAMSEGGKIASKYGDKVIGAAKRRIDGSEDVNPNKMSSTGAKKSRRMK